MSTLARFRKPNGLIQLIRLIETSEPDKRKKLLELVAKEDPGWAHMVQSKALSLERILSWPDDTLYQIFGKVPAPLLASLTQEISETEVMRFKSLLSASVRREVEELASQKRASTQERWVACIKVFQCVRELQDEGSLRLASIDPGLDIDLRLVG